MNDVTRTIALLVALARRLEASRPQLPPVLPHSGKKRYMPTLVVAPYAQ